MSSFALASFGSLDRFDNGTGRLDLPIDYDDYFRLFNNPDLFAHAEAVGSNGQQRIRLDSVFIKLILEWGYNLARKISAASYGGTFPNGHVDSLTLRAGSLEEIGLVPPPLFQLLSRFQDHGFPLGQSLVKTDFIYWMQTIRENAQGTREWLVVAQRCAHLLGRATGWDFDLVTTNPGRSVILASLASRSSPIHSDNVALIPHPIVGTEASNAVAYCPPTPHLSTCPLPTRNPCCTIIPHPIYGPNTQNTMVPRSQVIDATSDARVEKGLAIERPRAPSPWSACSSNLEYPDSPALSYADLSRAESPALSYASTEYYSDDSSEPPSGDDEPTGYFTVYESEFDSETEWEEVTIEGNVDAGYAGYQAEAECALYQEEGTSSNPIDLTD